MLKLQKIEKLNQEQERRLEGYYKEWLEIGRNVEPINMDAARETIIDFYARLGKPAPVVLRFSSPAMCILANAALRSVLPKEDQLWGQLGGQLWGQLGGQLRGQLGDQLWGQLRGQLGGQLGDQLWDQLGGQLGDQLWDQLGDQLRDQLRDQLWDQLRDQLRDQLWGQLRGQLGGQLGDQLWDQLRDQLRGQLRYYFGGQHWSHFEAFYNFCREIGVEYSPAQNSLLDLWIRQSRSLHWWFPYEGVVLLSDRHNILKVDEQGRLHSESGPACGYSDGWGVWAWHGTRVSRQLIESPETLSIKQVRDEQNAEVRRVMIERMGWDRFCSAAALKVIHTDTLTAYFPALPVSETVHAEMRFVTKYREGQEVAELLISEEFLDFDDRPLKFVRVTDPSTGERYVLRVWPENVRAYEAIAKTFGMTEEQYKSSVYSHS
jgi:hypothetical protein